MYEYELLEKCYLSLSNWNCYKKYYYLSMISPRLRFMVTGLDRDCVFSKFVICNVVLIDVIELSTILVASCTGCDEL